MPAPLLEDHQDGITTLTFNQPQSRNALSMEMRAALFEAIDRIAADDAVRCLVLRGAGGCFMAGGDIRTFAATLDQPRETRRQTFEGRLAQINQMMRTLVAMPKPVIASISGPAAGAGLSLALACDMAIGDETAMFAMAYRHLGLSPDAGGSWFLPRLVGTRRAMELMLLGDRISAEDAHRLGILNRLVAADALEAETEALAHRLATGPTQALAATRQLINAAHSSDSADHFEQEARHFTHLTTTPDWEEAVTAFMEKRKPQFGRG